ncbi:MAG: polyprenyl synthetase family protein [Clostridiales bacterium]|nr:polyprenyl synthetase family protein [Clostridiales bacterium]
MSYIEDYAVRKEECESYIRQFAAELITYPETLYNAVSYSLLSGGKRLRPMLLLEAVRMFGGKVDACAVNFALAVECIHTYSLIHDDLPCMDNDDYRRGKLTCHKKFGEANAVLAGDALLNLAYELIFGAIRLGNNNERYIRAGSIIASAAGGNGLVGGQTCDLMPNAGADGIDAIYEKKTADLICAALKAGALIGGASEEALQKTEAFGKLFGYCVQLRDDLLDKDTEEEDKNTYLRIHGVQQTEIALKEKTVQALRVLGTLENATFLTELTTDFMERNA